jgi:hypothetical protein
MNRPRALAVFFLLVLPLAALPAPGQAPRFELEAGFSGWTLAPFHPLLESRTETAVREAFRDALGTTFLGVLLSPLSTEADFSGSTGRTMSATLWMRLGESRFSLGLRAETFSFRIPFSLEGTETVAFLGIPLASVDGRSSGTVRLRGFGGTLLGRWLAVETRRFELAIVVGLMLFPYEGTIDQDIAATIRTPLGDATLAGPYDMTVEEARGWTGGGIPKAVVSPSAGIAARYRLSGRLGIFLGLTASQGTFLSGGLFFGF